MLKESLLAYLLYKYTLYRTFIIKLNYFYCKAKGGGGGRATPLDPPLVATEVKTNEWTEIEL